MAPSPTDWNIFRARLSHKSFALIRYRQQERRKILMLLTDFQPEVSVTPSLWMGIQNRFFSSSIQWAKQDSRETTFYHLCFYWGKEPCIDLKKENNCMWERTGLIKLHLIHCLHVYALRVYSHAPSIRSHRGEKVVFPDFQPMRVSEEPVCIDILRENPFFIYRRPTLYPLEIAVDFFKSP
jgi:hypothetical protein